LVDTSGTVLVWFDTDPPFDLKLFPECFQSCASYVSRQGEPYKLTSSMTVAAIILAAGASRRLGQPKQLLEVDGEALLARATRLAMLAGATPVVVVLGAHYELIRSSVQFDDVIFVFNVEWEQGMATSLYAGLRALDDAPNAPSAALIMSCDQPRLTTDHLRNLISAFGNNPGPPIVASTYAGIRGVPAVFPRSVFPALMKLHGDQGARKLLADPSLRIVTVELIGGEIDIDLPSDLANLHERKRS
jgi:molybdenum cofactor cytidylyltransferase